MRAGVTGGRNRRGRCSVFVARSQGINIPSTISISRMASASWVWTRDGEPTGELQYRVGSGLLELRYGIVVNADHVEAMHFRVAILARPCRYGGMRNYFVCPICGRTCEVIVMTTSARRWGCRKCLRLRYRSQGSALADRMQRRADVPYERAGTDYSDTVVKHKWMRWRTYNRLIDRANALSGDADAAFLYRVRRFGCNTPFAAMASSVLHRPVESAARSGRSKTFTPYRNFRVSCGHFVSPQPHEM